MKRAIITIIFIILAINICGCTPYAPFDASLAGSYEIMGAQPNTINYLHIKENGEFHGDTMGGWALLGEDHTIRLQYHSGVARTFSYTQDGYHFTLHEGDMSYPYIDADAFTLGGDKDIPLGLYCDKTGTILMDFSTHVSGTLLGIGDKKDYPFTYTARDSIVRFQYGEGDDISFEYMGYAMIDGQLQLTWPSSQDTVLLSPQSDLPLWGDYTLLYHSADAPELYEHFSCHDSILSFDEDVITFQNGVIYLHRDNRMLPYRIVQNGLLTTFISQWDESSYTYMHDSLFLNEEETLRDISGIYASEDLSLIIKIQPDGQSGLTKKGMDSFVSFATRNQWLKCIVTPTGEVTYFHYKQKNNGLLLAEAATGADEASDYIYLKKLQ